MKAYMMVEPTKVKPRFLRSFESASDSGLVAGTLLQRRGRFTHGPAADEAPHVGVEAAEFPLHGEEGLRVAHRAFHLQAIANDARVGEQLLDASMA